ncbi:TonB-dependent receptor [Sphingopyxis sp. GW247-27LB]|nr:TonB-dependent receptor [Sphingopyxis sp. GW247-27LB]
MMASVAAGCVAAASPAAAQTKTFDIAAQPAATGISTLGRQADVQIAASRRVTKGKRTNAVRGTMTVEKALQQLLDRTGLIARRTGPATFAVIAAGPTELLDSAGESSTSFEGRPTDQRALEENDPIIVTGTRIEGGPPSAPVIQISSEDIRNAGQSDLGEVARSLPQSFGGGQNPGIGNTQGAPNENANVNGASTFNLRGIGSNATLTLLNGNRFAYTGVSSVLDVSAIPVAAVERIEIVPDGASAIYGADAVAGVVNILLKRDYDGVSAMARVGASTEGGNTQQQYGLLGGKTWSSGSLLAAYDYSQASAVHAGDRSYATANNPETTLFPRTWRHSVLVSGHQALGPDITLAADLLYKKSRIHSVTGYDLVLAPNVNGIDNFSSSEIFGIAPSLTAELGGDWRFKASGFFGTDRTGGYADIYVGGALARHNDKHFFNRNLALEAGMEGSLTELPAGALSVAFGAGVRRQDFFGILPFNDIDRRRDNLFAYGELLVPLASPAQATDGLHRLALTGALRFEDYSDAASIVTPKLGIIWEPVAILRLGASWGRSFKMPTLYQQYGGYYSVLARAARYGTGYPANATVLIASGPDSRLGPERSENLTLSAQLTPTRGLELTAAWYQIDYSDRVAAPTASLVGVLDNPLYAGLVTLNPDPADLAVIFNGSVLGLENSSGLPYDPANVVAFIDSRTRNIARQRYSGLDLSVRYRTAISGDRELSLSAAGSFLRSRQQLISGAPWTRLAATIFHPPHFRGRAGLTYGGDRYSFSAFVNHMSGLDDDRQIVTVRIPSYSTVDLTVRVRIGRRFDISLAALNLFDAKPTPISTASPFDTPFDTTNYSAVGRFVGLTLRQEW